MTSTEYDVGDLVQVQGTFTNAAGALVDPTTVNVQYRFDEGGVTQKTYGAGPDVVRASLGIYYLRVDTTNQAGRVCYYRFFSTGTGQTAGESQFTIKSSQLD